MGKGRLLTTKEVENIVSGTVYVESENKAVSNGLYDYKDKYFCNKQNDHFYNCCAALQIGQIKVYEYIEEPKTYKTSEMIAMLEENQELRFKTDEENENKAICYRSGNEICIKALENVLYTTDTWTLIEDPKEVTFMEAVKAFNEGKTIKCLYKGDEINYVSNYLGIIDENRRNISVGEILEGKWYIMEESK